MRCRQPHRVALALLLALATCGVWAGSFSVTPVRIYMALRDRAIAVTLVNEGDTPIVLQADLNQWRQAPDGRDELIPTEDLILSPPIIKLAPGARQVVRLARIAPPDLQRQLTYRLIMREVPEATPAKEGVQVTIALALSMPVFITPPGAKRELACEFTPVDPQFLGATCDNRGNAYAQIRSVRFLRGEQALAQFQGGEYFLPGSRKTILVKAARAVAAGPAKMVLGFDDGQSQSFDVVLP